MEFNFKPHAVQAFHWERDTQAPIGHVTKFQVATTSLSADITLNNPMVTSGNAAVTVVGALDEVKWAGKPGSTLELSFVVSTGNRRNVLNLLHQNLDNADVTMGFVVYDYDPVEKKYFKAFHTGGTPITGKVKTGSGDRQLEELEEEDAAAAAEEAEDRNSQMTQAEKDARRKARAEEKKNRDKRRRELKLAKLRGEDGKELDMSVAATPEDEPLSPQVWMFHVSVIPPGEDQNVHFAAGHVQPIAKQWGFTPPT